LRLDQLADHPGLVSKRFFRGSQVFDRSSSSGPGPRPIEFNLIFLPYLGRELLLNRPSIEL
jgi:hypothetical protein